MTRNELLAKLQSIEWSEIEFKGAEWAAPKDSLQTVSAFSISVDARQAGAQPGGDDHGY